MPALLRWTRLLALCALCLANVRAAAPDDILERTSRDDLFQVIGLDFAGIQTVGAISDQMEGLGLHYFPEARALPEPIRVTLSPDPGFPEPYRISPQPNGNFFIYVRWDADTRFGDVCQALASAFVRRAALWRFGREATPPHWLELALGQLLEARIRPGYADTQREEALARPPMGLEELLAAQGPFGLEQEKVALNAVWFFRLLENRVADRVVFRRALAAFLKGLDPTYILVKVFPRQFAEPGDLEMWWAVGFQAMVRSRETPFFTMEQSRQLVGRLAIVTVDVDGQDQRLAGTPLWTLREREEAASALRQRQREIKLEIQRVNPVYYNALLSLGLFFEAALQAPSEVEAEAANQRFLNDFREAQALELEIKRLLRW